MAKKVVYTRCNCGDPSGHVGAVWHEGQSIPEGVTIAEPVDVAVQTKAKEVTFGAVTIRCGCPSFEEGMKIHGNPLRPCPTPRSVTDLGVVAYHTRNPFKWLAWKAGRITTERRLRKLGELT